MQISGTRGNEFKHWSVPMFADDKRSWHAMCKNGNGIKLLQWNDNCRKFKSWWIGEARVKLSSGPRFNIKMLSYQCSKSHCGYKTILQPSYLQNGNSYTGKMTSLYWIRALVPTVFVTHGISHKTWLQICCALFSSDHIFTFFGSFFYKRTHIMQVYYTHDYLETVS